MKINKEKVTRIKESTKMKNYLIKIFMFGSMCITCTCSYAQSSFFEGFLQGMADGLKNSNSSSSSTKQSRNLHSNSTVRKNSTNSTVSGNKRREELGSGGFVIVEEFPTFQTRTRWGICPSCRGARSCAMCYGSRQCTFCKGKGIIISAATGDVLGTCATCNRTGLCNVCKGKGVCICNEGDYPGYVIRGIKQVDNDGNVMLDDKTDYSGRTESSKSSSRSSASRSSSAHGSCSKCGGRRYESTSYRYAPASTSGWAQPYHNTGGSSCPYCEEETDHYHHPCSGCRGFGHN